MRVLITGAAGYIGSQLGKRLVALGIPVLGVDLTAQSSDAHGFEIRTLDIRSAELVQHLQEFAVTHVVHLASVVSPGKNEALEYDIDVNGTRNVLDCCLQANVRHLTVTSSGAAYGYHADNPEWLRETDALRGNDAFSYSKHKRLVEALLATYQQQHPRLQQLILRPGTILGANTNNMITRLFNKRFVLKVLGYDSPFVFIWDQDVVDILVKGVTENITGAFNVAGDGALSVSELATIMNKPVLSIPAKLLRWGLWFCNKLGLSQAGANHLLFLQFRPVLDNAKLKSEFGFQPQKSSREVFEYYLQHRHNDHD
ncbi:MAG: nucleoside-diphosphate-sugar epimerase [Idiomarinaceae bacterium HL-53]|nr:MAG: nucleoside-diphosphate-sugar epimerase [Idiomarinaceae bacterium HL-53]CUS47913.1 UDP-glucose 4-epimerase [Idiomarinaceae bacterium HL-53]